MAAHVIVLACAWPDAARADESVAAAAFRAGREALREGDHDVACTKFRLSEQTEPSAGARLNLGDCALQAQDFVEAIRYFQGAAELSTGERQTFAARRAEAARTQAAELHLVWATPILGTHTRVELDGRSVAVPASLTVNPGRHVVVVRSSASQSESRYPVELGRAGMLRIELGPVVARPAPAIVRSTGSAVSTRRSPWAYVLMGTGAAALLAGAASGFVAKGAIGNIDGVCKGERPCDFAVWARDDVRAEYARAGTWATTSTAYFVGGAVAIAAGVIVWLATAPPRRVEPRAR